MALEIGVGMELRRVDFGAESSRESSKYSLYLMMGPRGVRFRCFVPFVANFVAFGQEGTV